jgi:hypothetical protein
MSLQIIALLLSTVFGNIKRISCQSPFLEDLLHNAPNEGNNIVFKLELVFMTFCVGIAALKLLVHMNEVTL